MRATTLHIRFTCSLPNFQTSTFWKFPYDFLFSSQISRKWNQHYLEEAFSCLSDQITLWTGNLFAWYRHSSICTVRGIATPPEAWEIDAFKSRLLLDLKGTNLTLALSSVCQIRYFGSPLVQPTLSPKLVQPVIAGTIFIIVYNIHVWSCNNRPCTLISKSFAGLLIPVLTGWPLGFQYYRWLFFGQIIDHFTNYRLLMHKSLLMMILLPWQWLQVSHLHW